MLDERVFDAMLLTLISEGVSTPAKVVNATLDEDAETQGGVMRALTRLLHGTSSIRASVNLYRAASGAVCFFAVPQCFPQSVSNDVGFRRAS